MSALVEATVNGLSRIEALVRPLSEDSLRRVLDSGWTVAATLAHLAFWDRWVEARWSHFLRTGAFHDLPDDITDLVNEAAKPEWHAVPAGESVRLCLDAAASVTRTIQRLSSEHILAAVETGRLALVDRTVHWYPHVDEIDSSQDDLRLGGDSPDGSR
jgi:hypothetical protein